ncbi:MAG: EamA family transporter [Chloroflexi bacterium]|nr:EamA family transporter [Chloroflexota bacterium]
MTLLALALVLLSALVHASWNLLSKQAHDKLAFFCGATMVTCAVFLPLGLWLALTHPVPLLGWGILLLSSLFEALYFWSLAQAYRFGDLSLVYPLARGSGLLLVPLLGVLLLGERLSERATLGVLLIAAGIVTIQLPMLGWQGLRALGGAIRQPGTRYALLTGLIIAAFSTVDKLGVALVPPVLYVYVLHLGIAIGLTFILRGRRAKVVAEWQRHPARVVAVGLLSPTSYGLVLLTLTFTPVSYVVPAREVSVVIAALLGVLVLREPYGPQRLLGSALIGSGLFLLAGG